MLPPKAGTTNSGTTNTFRDLMKFPIALRAVLAFLLLENTPMP